MNKRIAIQIALVTAISATIVRQDARSSSSGRNRCARRSVLRGRCTAAVTDRRFLQRRASTRVDSRRMELARTLDVGTWTLGLAASSQVPWTPGHWDHPRVIVGFIAQAAGLSFLAACCRCRDINDSAVSLEFAIDDNLGFRRRYASGLSPGISRRHGRDVLASLDQTILAAALPAIAAHLAAC